MPNILRVKKYRDNPDGSTTNFLSDGSTSTVKYRKTKYGMQPREMYSTKTIAPYSLKGWKNVR